MLTSSSDEQNEDKRHHGCCVILWMTDFTCSPGLYGSDSLLNTPPRSFLTNWVKRGKKILGFGNAPILLSLGYFVFAYCMAENSIVNKAFKEHSPCSGRHIKEKKYMNAFLKPDITNVHLHMKKHYSYHTDCLMFVIKTHACPLNVHT